MTKLGQLSSTVRFGSPSVLPFVYFILIGYALVSGVLDASLFPFLLLPLPIAYFVMAGFAFLQKKFENNITIINALASMLIVLVYAEIHFNFPNLWVVKRYSVTELTYGLMGVQATLLFLFSLAYLGAFGKRRARERGSPIVENYDSVTKFTHYNLVFICIFFVLLIWELYSNKILGITRELPFIPPPSAVVNTFIEDAHLLFVKSTIASLIRLAWGFGIGCIMGFLIALGCGYWKTLDRVMDPFARLIAPIPPPAWVPFALAFFPLVEQAGYFMIWLGAFFMTLINTLVGLKTVDQRYVEAARMLGAKESLIYRRVIIPLSIANIFMGLMLALLVGIIMLIVTEAFGVTSGVGYYIHFSWEFLDYTGVVAGMIWIGILTLILSNIITLAEKKLTPWR